MHHQRHVDLVCNVSRQVELGRDRVAGELHFSTVTVLASLRLRMPAAASQAFNAFLNNIAVNCPLSGVAAGGYYADASSSVDEVAAVGNIVANAARSSSFCGSGLAFNVPQNVNALSGTHVWFEQNFSFGNINGACSPNSNFVGGFTTTKAAASVGASSISVASVSGWGVGWPIVATPASGVNGVYDDPAIPTPNSGASSTTTPTLVSSVAEPRSACRIPLPPRVLVNGQNLSIGTSTDGNGLIFDTWAVNSYIGQSVVRNNVFWGNGSTGFQMFCARNVLELAQGLRRSQHDVRQLPGLQARRLGFGVLYSTTPPAWGRTSRSPTICAKRMSSSRCTRRLMRVEWHDRCRAGWNGTTHRGRAVRAIGPDDLRQLLQVRRAHLPGLCLMRCRQEYRAI